MRVQALARGVSQRGPIDRLRARIEATAASRGYTNNPAEIAGKTPRHMLLGKNNASRLQMKENIAVAMKTDGKGKSVRRTAKKAGGMMLAASR